MEQKVLPAELRKERGTASVRRMRLAGFVPGIIYGHKEEPVAVRFRREDVHQIVTHRVKMVSVRIGDTAEQVLVKDVQFDVFGDEVLHLDLERVAMDQVIEVECPVEFTGTAKGAAAGGVIEHPVTDLRVSCLPTNIPEVIKVHVSDMVIGDTIYVRDIKAPEGVRILTDPDAIVITIRAPLRVEEAAVPAGEAPAEEAAEPEVIRRPKSEEEEEEEEAEGKRAR